MTMTFEQWCRQVGYDGGSNGWARIAWDASAAHAAVAAERKRLGKLIRLAVLHHYGYSGDVIVDDVLKGLQHAEQDQGEAVGGQGPTGAGGEATPPP